MGTTLQTINAYEQIQAGATSTLDAMSMENDLSLFEVLSKMRNNLVGNDSIRGDTIYATGNPISKMCSYVKDIIPDLEKLNKEYSEIDWSKLSKEELIAKASDISFQLVRIHPYSDGNGRTHRMLLDHILLSNGIESPILYRGDDSKTEYGKSMQQSNRANAEPFGQFVLEQYKAQFEKSKQIIDDETEEEKVIPIVETNKKSDIGQS